jgi:hypothetical protein
MFSGQRLVFLPPGSQCQDRPKNCILCPMPQPNKCKYSCARLLLGQYSSQKFCEHDCDTLFLLIFSLGFLGAQRMQF